MSRDNYREFTQPAELHKAINILRGIVAGIKSDETVSVAEMTELIHWCEIHADLRERHPFSEIIPVVEGAIEDGVVTGDEAQDILWVCNNFADNGHYYNEITSSIQFLAGLIHGVMADGELSDGEIASLKSWINDNEEMAGTYPFDEINSLLYMVLEDKMITSDEREQLMAFFSNLIEFKDSYNLNEQDYAKLRAKHGSGSVCAVCPEVAFEGHLFCFTGDSYKASREEFIAAVKELGGNTRTGVSKKTDYLVVGNAGNPCWSYACYGRKIEEALNLRKNGAKVIIVNENDFWDAVEDTRAGIGE